MTGQAGDFSDYLDYDPLPYELRVRAHYASLGFPCDVGKAANDVGRGRSAGSQLNDDLAPCKTTNIAEDDQDVGFDL